MDTTEITNQLLSDRGSDSGIENCSMSGNSSVLLINNVNSSLQNAAQDHHLNESSSNDSDYQNEFDPQATTNITTTTTTTTSTSTTVLKSASINISNNDSVLGFEVSDFDGASDKSTSSCSSNPDVVVKKTNKVTPKSLDLTTKKSKISKRHDSQSSEKTCEIDLIEERDTFSPLNPDYANDNQSSSSSTNNICINMNYESINNSHDSSAINDVDNKIFSKKKTKPTSSTKEEKQRQNEEIVIMETSSISSETGSWESVFPHRNINTEVKDCCKLFLNSERNNCVQCIVGDTTESDKPGQISPHPSSSSSVTACFIDASTLLDESEITCLDMVEPKLPTEGCFKPRPTDDKFKSPEEKSSCSEDSDKDAWPNRKHLNKLERFHKSFELCKTKISLVDQPNNSNSNNGSDDSSNKANSDDLSNRINSLSSSSEENTNNLSDEEKLWKRENLKKTTGATTSNFDVKDQYNKENVCVDIFNNIKDKEELNISRQGNFEVDDEETIRKRQDQERKQGNLVFKNSIQQFSGHLISPRLSYPQTSSQQSTYMDYSTSPGSIRWSENDDGNKMIHDTSFSSTTTDDVVEQPSDISDSYIFRSGSHHETHSQQQQIYCVLPDTPNNSIVQIDASLKRIANDTSYGGDSDNSVEIKIPKRRCDVESAPIVSGGASIKDFTPKQCESPPVRRKTETCPIVSGGIAYDFKDLKNDQIKIKDKSKMSQSVQSWVVDMSDCKSQRRRRSTSSSSSTENTARSIDASYERDRTNSGSISQKSGLGFYVSLNDIEPANCVNSELINTEIKCNRSLNEKCIRKSTGFYVDLSESENSRNVTPPPSANTQTPPVSNGSNDKKNIFSMFIDFGDKKIVPKREPISLASRLSNSLHQRRESDLMKTNSSSTETLISNNSSSSSNNHHNNRQQLMHCDFEKFDSAGNTGAVSSDESRKTSLSFLMNDTNDLLPVSSSVVTFRSTSRNVSIDDSKRHSWNNSERLSTQQQQQNVKKGEHKRSSSLTADKGIMNILDKIPLISKTSSLSIDSPLSPFDDITCSKSELSTYSNNSNSITSGSIHSNGNDMNSKNIVNVNKKRRKDVQLNETFDKSSQGSITDGIFSKASSSPETTTDTEDLTFQQDENYCRAPESASVIKENPRTIIMETIIETKETSSPKKLAFEDSHKELLSSKSSTNSSTHTMETLHATMEKQKQLLETVNEHITETNSNFVKLSDMDKPISKFELHSPESMMSKSFGNHRNISKLFQDTKTRPYSWVMTRSTGNNIANITSSVENLRSISRLFPHLTKEFSNSLPSDVSQDVLCNRSPIENDYNIHSDISTESSLASSFSRSGMDESSLSCRQPRRLGEDLLKMFLQEIATDVIVEVNGRRIKAHKCILRSRCQYFAAMLAGGWVQSAGNVISLAGYSYSAVHFALCHIYSGASHPPEGISLMELAALADLLGLEGLKEVTTHALKLNYCHNFHKPCSGCIDGILQVLPVALNHALDDLYRKCLKWTCRHYLKVWPTRSFAQLPSDILGRCKQQVVAHLTSENVLETIMDCDHLISQLASFRWAIAIENLMRDILDAAYNYANDHFASIIASDSFLSLGHDKSNNIPLLENSLLRTASSLNPDQACRSYQRVTRLNTVLAAKVIKIPAIPCNDQEGNVESNSYEEEMEWNEEFIRLVSALVSAVEQCLIRQCARAMRVTSWQRMDLELRKKIQKLACLTEPLDLRRSKSLSKQTPFNSGSNRTQDLYQVKLAIQAHSKRALAQDTQLYRATTHTQTHTNDRNIQTIEKGIQANNENKDHANKALKSNSKINATTNIQQTVKPRNEKIKIIGHRRTQSEDSSSSTKSHGTLTSHHKNTLASNSARLSEIRPRYLEPRKPRGIPLKSATSSNIPLTMKGARHISSSDSSRTSSPATNKRLSNCQITKKIGQKSTNMSLDSLTSPSKRSDHLKKRSVDNEISVDSLAESMKSSMRTNKTKSQESLTCGNKVTHTNKENKILKTTPEGVTNRFAKNKSISCQNTSGSSPSSITNKSSRLSSTTSSMNSPRDAFKNRSISVPTGPSSTGTGVGTRKSFFTAKSREILARKSATNYAAKQSNSTTTTTANNIIKSNEKSPALVSGSGIAKCSSSSSISTRKIAPPTTLHLRKSEKNQNNSTTNFVQSPPKHYQSKIMTTKMANNIKSFSHNISPHGRNEMKIKKVTDSKRGLINTNAISTTKVEVVVVENVHKNNDKKQEESQQQQQRVESKLERSSTFCKESSDLPVSELQVID